MLVIKNVHPGTAHFQVIKLAVVCAGTLTLQDGFTTAILLIYYSKLFFKVGLMLGSISTTVVGLASGLHQGLPSDLALALRWLTCEKQAVKSY
jgi:hypothetical protein